jgi:ribosomal protein L7/L12
MSRGTILSRACAAAVIAIMLAGPGAALFPGTLRWSSWLACPRGTAPMTEEFAARHHTDETDGRFWCVAADGTAHERTVAAMGGLALMYFMGISVLFSLLAARRSTRDEPPAPRAAPWHDVPAEAEAKARELVAHGHVIHAIKTVREASGMGLKEAKEWVEALPKRPPRDPAAPPVLGIAAVPLPGITPEVEASARELLRFEGKIAAIALVREAAGIGLKEAKDWVEALPHRAPGTMTVPPGPPDAPPPASPAAVPPEVEARALELIAAGHTVSAIRVVREGTEMGLKDAKAWVEALIHRHFARPSPAPPPAAGAAERLAELKRMLDAGLVTPAEYEAKKARILAEL